MRFPDLRISRSVIAVCVAAASLVSGPVMRDDSRPLAHSVAPARTPVEFGINLTTVAPWAHERAFMNLLAGGTWLSAGRSPWREFDPSRIDRLGTVSSLQDGEKAAITLTRPPAAYGSDVDVACTFEGRGKLEVVGGRGIEVKSGVLSFTWPRHAEVAVVIASTDPSSPIRRLHCTESGADRAALYDPAFLQGLKPYRAVRFLDWQQVNENRRVSWATRTLPTSTLQTGSDGVAVEHMVTLANKARLNPWFVMPWQADAEYVVSFARYVRDHLDASLTAHVELGNEVWNFAFPIGTMVLEEAKARRLHRDANVARMQHYAERAAETMAIWERVFEGDRKRLVRVISGQADWPALSEHALAHRGSRAHFDAFATACYFGRELSDTVIYTGPDTKRVFSEIAPALERASQCIRNNKLLASRYGLRHVAYEAGQHFTYQGSSTDLLARLNRSPLMSDFYKRHLTDWARESGDLIMMYASVSPIRPSSAWGLVEYSGQPVSEAPKLRAVLETIDAQRSRPGD